MKRFVERGKTLLVDGPASVSILSGGVSVLGATLEIGEKTVVREGKRVPFWVGKRATFEIVLGMGASLEEADGNTVPPSWEDAWKKIASLKTSATIIVMGGVDSGKTSFCTFLANKALRKKWKTGIIDADLGQSDVGPPSTIGFNLVTAPIKDLFEIKAEKAYFVGVTSPSGAVNRVLEGILELKKSVIEAGLDLLIINTDGWVESEDAVKYKTRLVEKASPSAVVGIQQGDRLTPILAALNEMKILVIEPPQEVHRRNRDKRKILRELSYKKYLKQAKLHSFALNWIKVEGSPLGKGKITTPEGMKILNNLLGTNPLYCEETDTKILVVIDKSQAINDEQIERIQESFGKKAKVIRKSEEEGLLVGLEDEGNNFLGIGVLCRVDYKRKFMKVYTPVDKNVATLRFSQIKLDKSGRETGLSTVFTDYSP